MYYAIVTGSSKGLGEATTKHLLASGVSVIGISRTDNKDFKAIAKENDVEYTHLQADLSVLEELESCLEQLTSLLSEKDVSTLYLVNNAAMVEPIKRVEKITASELIKHYQLNVVSPMALMNHMIKISPNNAFVGVNITSGAAQQPHYGWSAYGSSKASIDMYTKTVAVEQRHQDTPHKVFAFSPGIMDTDMQGIIRETTAEDFVEVEQFKKYKNEDLLVKTEEVATILVDIMFDVSEIENGKVYHVREYF